MAVFFKESILALPFQLTISLFMSVQQKYVTSFSQKIYPNFLNIIIPQSLKGGNEERIGTSHHHPSDDR